MKLFSFYLNPKNKTLDLLLNQEIFEKIC